MGGGTGLKAPVDPYLGDPILGPEHKMLHNLPSQTGDQHPTLSLAKLMKRVCTGDQANGGAERKSLATAGAGGAVLMPELLGAEVVAVPRDSSSGDYRIGGCGCSGVGDPAGVGGPLAVRLALQVLGGAAAYLGVLAILHRQRLLAFVGRLREARSARHAEPPVQPAGGE